MLTPPVGLNLFVISGVTKNSMGWAIRACLPWLMVLLTFLAIITYVPWISLCLPEFLDKIQGY
jgi:C4-dicarboxylate transporter DctM subunit